MYFTQVKLNPARRDTARLVSSPQRIHAAVLDGFPPLGDERVLWRLDQDSRHESTLYVVSPDKPDYVNFHEMYTWSRLPYSDSIKSADYTRLLGRIEEGDTWGFRLDANTVKKKKSITREGGFERIVRTPLSGSDIDQWLLSREDQCGVVFKDFSSDTVNKAFPRKGQKMSLQVTKFQGVLEVTDADKLRNIMVNGIGPAKAHGCGLLTLSRVA